MSYESTDFAHSPRDQNLLQLQTAAEHPLHLIRFAQG